MTAPKTVLCSARFCTGQAVSVCDVGQLVLTPECLMESRMSICIYIKDFPVQSISPIPVSFCPILY